ncbi:hypothetical protein HBB16_21080 [Pseudonocardia sp. MCCB 268]|nr:hypothetical protein [Pseudonocardia cytotoxica]
MTKAAAKAGASARKAEGEGGAGRGEGPAQSGPGPREGCRARSAPPTQWNAKRVQRYLGIARSWPRWRRSAYAMAAAGQLRHRLDDHRSRKLGVSPTSWAATPGPGGNCTPGCPGSPGRSSSCARTARPTGTLGRSGSSLRPNRGCTTWPPPSGPENMPASRPGTAFGRSRTTWTASRSSCWTTSASGLITRPGMPPAGAAAPR